MQRQLQIFIRITKEPDGSVPDDLLRDMLDKSYHLVLGGFSRKKQQEILGENKKGE